MGGHQYVMRGVCVVYCVQYCVVMLFCCCVVLCAVCCVIYFIYISKLSLLVSMWCSCNWKVDHTCFVMMKNISPKESCY